MNKTIVINGLSAVLKIIAIVLTMAQTISPKYGALIYAVASIVKELCLVVGDWMDDGQLNKSFQKNLPGFSALALAALLFLGSGCAGFYSRQFDRSYFAPDGKTLARTETETVVRARTVWDAKSQLANFAASQSAKTQSTKVGALTAESTASNAVPVLRELRGIVEALPK